MKQLIIIFTRVDTATRDYFQNFFQNFNEYQDYWIVEHQNSQYILNFILDSTDSPIEELTNHWKNTNNNKYPFVFPHRGYNVSEQINWIDSCFESYHIYTDVNGRNVANAGDHHNKDGEHYFIILEASAFFSKNEIKKMDDTLNKIANLLIN